MVVVAMVETATGIETEAEAIAVGVDNTVVDTAEMGEHMGSRVTIWTLSNHLSMYRGISAYISPISMY